MSKFYSGLVGFVGALVVTGAGWVAPALALGVDPVAALDAPAAQPPLRRTQAELAAAVAGCGRDELCQAAIYLVEAQASTQRALHETLIEVDANAATQETDDATTWLQLARTRLTAARGD